MPYNGWSNYETWNVNLWLTNDEYIYESIMEELSPDMEDYEVGNIIECFVDNMNPIADQASLFTDLLGSALHEVDYSEIGTSFLEDIRERENWHEEDEEDEEDEESES